MSQSSARGTGLAKVFVESKSGLCLTIRDTAGAPNFLSACIDPWFCGPEGCPANYLDPHVGQSRSIRGRLTNETGSWKIVIKTIRSANPAVP